MDRQTLLKDLFFDIMVVARKEFLTILKDKRSRLILVMPILVQTLIFGYVASYDLNRIAYALLDEDRSHASRELVAAFEGSGIFRPVASLENSSQIAELVDNRQALVLVHIGRNFERQLALGHRVAVQVIVDGRNSNVAGIAASYATSIIETYSAKRLQERGLRPPVTVITTRAWFNPNLETRWNIIPGMIAVLALVQVMTLAGQSIAREKEQGSFDQLMVTPLGTPALMAGKALPPIVVGLLQSSMVLVIALFWFKIPYAGNFLSLYLGLFVFTASVVGLGLCVSALSANMQQAMLYSFSLLMPMILLSGFATPVASMPRALQWATLLNPVRHGVEFAQKTYLQGASLAEQTTCLALLALLAVLSLALAARLFRTRM